MVIHWLIKWKSAVCNAKRNRRVHGKLVLWYVCGLLRQTYYGSFEKGFTFKSAMAVDAASYKGVCLRLSISYDEDV
jgi:hypothetical protein